MKSQQFFSCIYSTVLVLFSVISVVRAQRSVPYFGKIQWVNGYAKEISGENISYFSAYPDYANTALLTRTTDGKKTIEWETAPVPKSAKGPFVYFSWVAAHSSGTSSGIRFFDLYVNGEKLLTFSTQPAHKMPDWSFAASDSSRILFQQLKRDGANDAHGLVFLRLPLSRVKPGEALRLKVIGQAQSSNDWYMTFKFGFEERVEVNPMPFLLKNGKQVLTLTTLHFGREMNFKITVNGKQKHQFRVTEGICNFDIPVNPVMKKDSVHILVAGGKRILMNSNVILEPVVHRDLHLIHHSHTDLGYSHLQSEMEAIHNKNIEDALMMIESTRNLPSEARFKWNIESIWVVENWLKKASPDQKVKFISAVKNGDISLSGMYLGLLTAMSQPEEMFHYFDLADRLSKEYGFEINSAMITDIPGLAWSTVTAMGKAGIRYFSSGPNYFGINNPYTGDRVGFFNKSWGDKPVWWQSPGGGEKVLFWTAGRGYSSWHGSAPGAIFDRGAKKIAAYLRDLNQEKYPYDIVQWRYNIVADNGPIDTAISRYVAFWNDKYASPKILLSTTPELFSAFEKKYGDKIPVVKGDITPYWEDGAFSTAYEEGKNRSNSLRLQQLVNLYAMLKPNDYDEDKFYQAWRDILLFHEHTWGAYNSISEPDVHFVKEQWRIKRQFLNDGEIKIGKLEKELLEPVIDLAASELLVVNTNSFKQSGLVTFRSSLNAKSLLSSNSTRYPLQKLSNGDFVFYAKDIPAFSTVKYLLSPDVAHVSRSSFASSSNSLSNGKIRIEWDSLGSITALNTSNGFNYAGNFKAQGLNSYWYVPGRDPSEAQTNGPINVAITESGPVLTTLSFISKQVPGAHQLEKRITLSSEDDIVFLENIVDKISVRTKESLHFGFPFNPSFTNAAFDAGYGTFRHLKDQLPGSNMDFSYGRRYMDVSGNDGKGMQLLFIEANLLQPESIIDERLVLNQSVKEWKSNSNPSNLWFSYAMNNYWHTNYKADQEGISKFRYFLKPHNLIDRVEFEKAAICITQPLIGFPVAGDFKVYAGLFELSNDEVIVTSLTPLRAKQFLVRIFNPKDIAAKTTFTWKDWQVEKMTDKSNGIEIDSSQEINIGSQGIREFIVSIK
jgi:hypothetical protein